MLTIVAASGLILFALWVASISLFAMFRPRTAIGMIGKFASTNLVNYTELVLRLLVGAAFVVVSARLAHSQVYAAIGWMMVISALILMVLPRRIHSGFAVFWSRRLPVWAIYPAVVIALVASAWLIGQMLPLVGLASSGYGEGQ